MPYVLFWDVSFDRVRRKPDTKHDNWHVFYFVAIVTKYDSGYQKANAYANRCALHDEET